jgi:hypothetical protein
MIEVVVVILILAVVTGAIVPRLLRSTRRQTEQDAAAVRSLLSAVGARTALTSQRIAIELDEEARELRVLVRKVDGDAADFDAAETWASDPLIPGAPLTDIELVAASVAGVPVEARNFRVEFDPSLPRPAVSLLVAERSATSAWRIDLPAAAMRAFVYQTPRATVLEPLQGAQVDLDAAGFGDSPW